MTLYCSQCGAPIEDGADFCYQCGALRKTAFDMDESGNLRPASENATRVCPHCGFSNPFSERSCQNCGGAMPPLESVRVPKALDSRDFLAIALGVIPGCIGVCGLGHFFYHRYSRGLMYLCISLIILYVEISLGYTSSSTKMFFIRILGFVVFFRSSMDLLSTAYYPPEPPSDKKGGE